MTWSFHFAYLFSKEKRQLFFTLLEVGWAYAKKALLRRRFDNLPSTSVLVVSKPCWGGSWGEAFLMFTLNLFCLQWKLIYSYLFSNINRKLLSLFRFQIQRFEVLTIRIITAIYCPQAIFHVLFLLSLTIVLWSRYYFLTFISEGAIAQRVYVTLPSWQS